MQARYAAIVFDLFGTLVPAYRHHEVLSEMAPMYWALIPRTSLRRSRSPREMRARRAKYRSHRICGRSARILVSS
jgi:hypothetical protein